MLLAHDGGELLAGEVAAPNKTAADSAREKEAAEKITLEYAPRWGGFDKRFIINFRAYELAKELPPEVSVATLGFSMDKFEAQSFIYDQETRPKLKKMHVLSRREVREKSEKYMRLYPALWEQYLVLERKFIEEGLP